MLFLSQPMDETSSPSPLLILEVLYDIEEKREELFLNFEGKFPWLNLRDR